MESAGVEAGEKMLGVAWTGAATASSDSANLVQRVVTSRYPVDTSARSCATCRKTSAAGWFVHRASPTAVPAGIDGAEANRQRGPAASGEVSQPVVTTAAPLRGSSMEDDLDGGPPGDRTRDTVIKSHSAVNSPESI